MALGLLVLAGWTFGWVAPEPLFPAQTAMKANTALGLILAGAALELGRFARAGPMRRLLSGLVIFWGAVNLAQHLFGWDLGIDQFLVQDLQAGPDDQWPGRMPLGAALSLIFSGLALLFLHWDTRGGQRPAEWLALAAALPALTAFVRHAFALGDPHSAPLSCGMVVHAALGFLALSAGIATARPQSGFMRTLVSGGPEGIAARILLPGSTALLFLSGFAVMQGWRLGFYDAETRSVLFLVSGLVVLFLFQADASRRLARSEAGRRAALIQLDDQVAANRASEAKLQYIADAADIGYWDWDIASDRLKWSVRRKIIIDVPAGDAISYGDFLSGIHPEDRERADAAMRQAVAGGGACDLEYRSVGPKGEERWTLLRGRVELGPDHHPLRLSGIAVDITRRKQTEILLQLANADLTQANDALVRSNLELQRFAYIAAHDLQTPLRSIRGFAQLLEKDYGGRLGPEADGWIQQIVAYVDRMHAAIQQLLAYSRIDSSGGPFEPVSLRGIFDEVAAGLEDAIRSSGAAVTAEELPVVLADRVQLAQVLQHLIENGIKYRRNEPPRIHLAAERRGEEWVISVRDNGIGIHPAHQERIFKVFGRLHTQQAYPGVGIGLAICRRIVQRHGGRIWLESEPGQGSTFFFSLPAAPDNPAAGR